LRKQRWISRAEIPEKPRSSGFFTPDNPQRPSFARFWKTTELALSRWINPALLSDGGFISRREDFFSDLAL
jgi:hypothetical protein